jgi:uncharacterized protein YukE
LDQDAFTAAKRELAKYIGNDGLEGLVTKLKASFEQLHTDWDSDAGKAFFQRFEDDLIGNLKKYAIVFKHINENLTTASDKYEEVFRVAETVAKSQY